MCKHIFVVLSKGYVLKKKNQTHNLIDYSRVIYTYYTYLDLLFLLGLMNFKCEKIKISYLAILFLKN